MADPETIQALNRITQGIYEIDHSCSTRLNGIEHGLVNVKLEFQERAHAETGKNRKKLTEEILIAWLLRRKICDDDCRARPDEEPYPKDGGKRCDLLFDINGAKRLWVELKIAWKAWFNCSGEGTYSNGWYQSYLDGSGRTHSFRHDLEKLAMADLPPGDGRVVCLVGTDCRGKLMDEEVAATVRDAQKRECRWELAAQKHWPDRRNADFRINVWCWLLQPVL